MQLIQSQKDEKERGEILCIVSFFSLKGYGGDSLAGPLPQHLTEAESPFQHHEKEESSCCLLVENKREKSSLSSPLPLQEIEEK